MMALGLNFRAGIGHKEGESRPQLEGLIGRTMILLSLALRRHSESRAYASWATRKL